MAVAHFRIRTAVQPAGGDATLTVPDALDGVDFRFVLVRDGGEEALIRVDQPADVLKRLANAPGMTRLTAKQLTAARADYPAPCRKQLYTEDRTITTFQTVRSGFYLIDVPVLE
ncbi:hypothetical protein BJY16_007527 [Actinoplanes octamycinicus]|uniref:Uncharacterized protein n=1 Tax=Actinoplanes octamycinicus TaxID=135948 RepID=A0A7W7H532_9ACTN|nr:hypothetical protein [Actinoplanes octamycinicus]MBB4744068.1 hypothetical protein [Actinoplanes octamycinicus]GIE56975.1 hypothetical protein Aoc01nite_23770 [Actinoplanes octamycinicus]